ncbi:MAG TPA: DNA polymerase Y family protein, partial [Puia sp.]|nr:DNA polymerase Y family protein [Puia sp.]
MAKRFVSIWFRHLKTDWFQLRRPALKDSPFVLAISEHGRKLVAAADPMAEAQGIYPGATVADARAIIPGIQVIDDIPGLPEKLLTALAAWAIRFTPSAAIDLPGGLLLDSTGCAHLWGGEEPYLQTIQNRLQTAGYDIRIAMADTIGAAWGQARYGDQPLLTCQTQSEALLSLPPAALRLEPAILDKLQKLGF